MSQESGDSQKRRENDNMAVKSRYMGYMRGIQEMSQRTEKSAAKRFIKRSTKESVLDRLKSLKGKEFHMTIPVKENADA